MDVIQGIDLKYGPPKGHAGLPPRWILWHTAKASLAVLALAVVFHGFSVAESVSEIYKSRCAACHGAHGAGDTMIGNNLKIHSLASDDVQKQSDDELFTIISRGRNRMPAFDRKLSPGQIRELVQHLRSLKK